MLVLGLHRLWLQWATLPFLLSSTAVYHQALLLLMGQLPCG